MFTFRRLAFALLIVLICLCCIQVADAQCPMCRMTVEGNLKEGGHAGRGLNRGILYMLAMPYIIVASLGFIWWKNNRELVSE